MWFSRYIVHCMTQWLTSLSLATMLAAPFSMMACRSRTRGGMLPGLSHRTGTSRKGNSSMYGPGQSVRDSSIIDMSWKMYGMNSGVVCKRKMKSRSDLSIAMCLYIHQSLLSDKMFAPATICSRQYIFTDEYISLEFGLQSSFRRDVCVIGFLQTCTQRECKDRGHSTYVLEHLPNCSSPPMFE